MEFNKKTATITVFIIGAMILAISAFADIKLGSGYTSFKEAIKSTAEKLIEETDNFTVEAVVSLKLDDKVFAESISNTKYDMKNNARESHDKNLKKGNLNEYYYYRDEKQNIHKDFKDDSYQVYEKRKTKENNNKLMENPFEEEQAKDFEKVIDAFVGNLQDTIQVEESNGSKMYIGNLSENQIPSTINALSSFLFKYGIMDEWSVKNFGIPYPKSNIHLLGAEGRAVENEEGIIESGLFTASISAEDADGVEHIYSMEFTFDIKDINNTLVKAPNLEGKKVIYSKEGFGFDEKYIGKYKNDIVKEEGNSFIKVGERFVEINSVENGNIKGKYYEVYKEGYEADNIRSFDFDAKYEESRHFTIMEYTNEKGEAQKGIIHQSNRQNIEVSLNVEIDENNGGYSYTSQEDGFNSMFTRVFE